MDQILSEKLNKTLAGKEFFYDFEIKERGLYGIEIIASAKSRRQNFLSLRSFLRNDDLAVKIDGISFPKKSGKKGLFDSEASWNGSELKGLNKTILFLIKLVPGKHQLNFSIEQEPKLENIKIFQIKETEISYLPQDNELPQEGNRRPWLAIVLCNLGLNFLKINASAKEGKKFLFFKRDDSDLKLIINGEIQKNKEPKSHKHWHWCGRTLKGESKIFEKEFSPKSDIHYIELWADRNPEVEEIKIGIGEGEEIKIPETIYPIFTLNDIQFYAYKGVKNDENYSRFDGDILEAVNHWNKFFFLQKYPPKEPLHPNLVKATIYIESRMGYGKGGFPDVMQVWDEANNTPQTIRNEQGYPANEYISDNKIGHMDYSYPKEWLPPKVETPKESIFWGIRWLYHKAQKSYGIGYNNLVPPIVREWKSWEQVIADYNSSDSKQEYQKKIWRIYKQGIDQDENILWGEIPNGFSIIKTLCLIGLLATAFWLGGAYGINFSFFCEPETKVCDQNIKDEYAPYYTGNTYEANQEVANIFLKNLEEYKKEKNYYGSVFQETVKMCEEKRCDLEFAAAFHFDQLVDYMKSNKQFLEATAIFDFMKNVQEGDIDNDGENEIIFIRKDVLNADYITIAIIDKINNQFKMIEKKMDDGCDAYAKLLDVTGDLQPEILLFMCWGREGYPLTIYQFLEDKSFKEIFNGEFASFPSYTLSDLDHDGRMEIRMEGSLKDAPRDYHAIIQRTYEYSKEKNTFIKTKETETEI
ncbi:hypothetical protein KKB98_00525 [Patescibacteria group bacterium]|nr:hypothetical protein [Patescibacteria group bacterium]